MKTPNIIKIVGGVVSAILSYLYGSADGWITALICMCVLDYLTGIAQAFVNKNLNSAVGFRGIAKKIVIFVVVAVANIVDNLIGANGVLRVAVIGFYLSNESLSVLENGGKIGVAYPQKLIDILSQLKEDGNNGNTK